MNRRTSRTTALAAPIVALALALSACGSDTAAPATPASAQGISTQFNDADAAFIKDMVPHHTGALDMTELAPTRAASGEVKALAARIAGEQEPEITRMQAMSTAWKVELPASGTSRGGAGMSTGKGMSMGDDDVAALTPLQGAPFDREWLTRMIAHHTSAVSMSEVELAKGENPQGKELAEQIIAAQKAEISQMQALLAAA